MDLCKLGSVCRLAFTINTNLTLVFFTTDELTVSVAIFSGRPDPVWQLSASNPAQATQYSAIKTMLASNVKKFYPAQMPARLGFKGFLVQEGKNEPYLIIGPETKELQLQLLASMPLDLPGDSSLLEDNIKEVKEAVNSGVIIAEEVPQPSASTLRSKRAAPPYLPQQWFLNRKIRECNNCYNYANNVRTYTFAQPGEATGTPFQLNNPPSVQASAVSDNLAVLAPNPPQPLVLPNPGPNQHYVALVVDPGKQ